MKTLSALLIPAIAMLFVSCELNDPVTLPAPLVLSEDRAHFDIYIELLPDPSLNRDEQSQQKYRLRLLTRGGYQISLYQILPPPSGESMIRYGVSSHVGNYRALDMPLGTYHIFVKDQYGVIKDVVVTPPGGKLTTMTFSFAVPG